MIKSEAVPAELDRCSISDARVPQVRTEAYRDALQRNTDLIGGKRVLDIGCGTGILSMFAARGGASSVVGVRRCDPSLGMHCCATAA